MWSESSETEPNLRLDIPVIGSVYRRSPTPGHIRIVSCGCAFACAYASEINPSIPMPGHAST